MTKPSSIILLCCILCASAPLRETSSAEPWKNVVGNYCLDCHDSDTQKGDLNLESLFETEIAEHSDIWEKVVRQLDARQMPPIGKDRPDEAGYENTSAGLISLLDTTAAARPNPGRTDTIRRLTRTEYQNAIRDLLAVEIDTVELLPADESSHGFDNVTVGDLSPALLDRYLTAAQKISRLAVGTPLRDPESRTVRIRPDLTQEEQVEGLPPGTRGGALIRHTFPEDGDYEVRIFLTRDRNEMVEGLRGSHDLEILLNQEPAASLKIIPPKNGKDHTGFDANLITRFPVKAGPQDLGVTFVKWPSSLEETLRQPYEAHFNYHRHPRLSPAIYQLTITGPFDGKGPGESPSRDRIFIAKPESPDKETDCARTILKSLMRHAFRRPVTDADLESPLAFFAEGRENGGSFDSGIERALSSILVSREFLFRVENDPKESPSQTPYSLNDFELASRLSFFLWSSLPDEELLATAERGELHDPAILESQARRMLTDPRARSLVTNFADQWLYLRNLDAITPDGRLFPGFDDNLRQAFRQETELLFASVIHEERSVLNLLKTNEAFLNERLAKHYDIPHVYGTRFRRVSLSPDQPRGGLLRQGSILTVTSYATRTSPVIRGHWILKNLLGTPPPPPPPDVPALEDNAVSASLPIRERLAEHRKNVACASCHNVMDPPGFALENFDAVGRWRTTELGLPVDATGGMSDGSEFIGVDGLEKGMLNRPELFVRTLTEKLLTFALGRGVEPSDAPAIRQIVRRAGEEDYVFSTIIFGLVTSEPFRMRMTE
jgi:hypothetical protein